MTIRIRLVTPLLASLVLAVSACRDPVFFPEFEVDVTDVSHGVGDASIDQDGEFVVSWSESTEVLARTFSPITSPKGGPFLMNADTTPGRGNSSIARDASGRFVIVWNEDGLAIRGQRFEKDGTPIGENFTVATNAQADLSLPLVASDDESSSELQAPATVTNSTALRPHPISRAVLVIGPPCRPAPNECPV